MRDQHLRRRNRMKKKGRKGKRFPCVSHVIAQGRYNTRRHRYRHGTGNLQGGSSKEEEREDKAGDILIIKRKERKRGEREKEERRRCVFFENGFRKIARIGGRGRNKSGLTTRESHALTQSSLIVCASLKITHAQCKTNEDRKREERFCQKSRPLKRTFVERKGCLIIILILL